MGGVCPKAGRAKTALCLGRRPGGRRALFSLHSPPLELGRAVGFVVNLFLDSRYKKRWCNVQIFQNT